MTMIVELGARCLESWTEVAAEEQKTLVTIESGACAVIYDRRSLSQAQTLGERALANPLSLTNHHLPGLYIALSPRSIPSSPHTQRTP